MPPTSDRHASTASTSPLRIAVIGGGIGGLAAAAFLHRAHLDVTLYEQAASLGEVGAGLVVSPNAARLVRRLGTFDAFLAKAVPLQVGWEFRRWDDGSVLFSQELGESCLRLYGEQTFTAHRADLVEVLRAAVPPERIRLGRRCVALEQTEHSVRIRFADGPAETADLVIGADGIHSVVRNAVSVPQSVEYSGMCAYRAIVPATKAPAFARAASQTLWIGPGHHLVHYPISGGKAINLVAFAPAGDFTTESWSSVGTTEEFLAEFEGWDHRLTELITAAPVPGRWALLDRAPLESWCAGRIGLLGDAAHPMFPFFAQGSAQAIEDAAALAVCLTAGTDSPQQALKTYERMRMDRVTTIQTMSHARKDINHLPDGPAQEARDARLVHEDPLEHNRWLYGYDAEAEAIEALKTMTLKR
ncbi:FAD-dependent monooxygenase [Parafrigoribacterium mesophilum]|uniref:FAD-dependent monooxygenase n=1 Tax=Parafrigoribacterium mesophilum TaxID=433646 RepID=UPI0031FD4452